MYIYIYIIHVHVLNIYIRMHACITHQLKKSKPFCASLVVQSAAMQTPSFDVVHELGDRVHHWQTGRCGTVTGVHENGDRSISSSTSTTQQVWKMVVPS